MIAKVAPGRRASPFRRGGATGCSVSWIAWVIGVRSDERVREAIKLIASKRDSELEWSQHAA